MAIILNDLLRVFEEKKLDIRTLPDYPFRQRVSS